MIFYKIHDDEPRFKLEKASYRRPWMEKTEEHYAYRCLPMTIANMLGYHIIPREPVEIYWDGGTTSSSISVIKGQDLACSIFGHGVITFHIDWLISTDDNTNLFITGPINHVIDNTQALTGVYETDWAPFSFTMNWKVLKPGLVKFTEEDPICHIFPFPREYVETVPVHVLPLSTNAVLNDEYNKFTKSRSAFIESHSFGWQKNYFKGQYTDGRQCPITNHQTKISMPNIDE